MSGEIVRSTRTSSSTPLILTQVIGNDKSVELFRRLTPENCVLSLQALCEFCAAVTRKELMPVDDAMAQIGDWQQIFPAVFAKGATLVRATAALKRYQLSFWEAMLWATVREAGVSTLLTEDFQHGQSLDGVRLVNPFKLTRLDEILST